MNTFKTATLLGALTVMLVLGGRALAGPRGMTLALGFAILMNGIAYFFSDKIALAMSGARPVSREEAPRFYAIAEGLCGKAGLPLPKLYVIPQAAPNAFATGRSPQHASVAVTAGLLQALNEEEVEGVLAHELAHVRNYDILTASVAATLAGAITWIAEMARWAMIFGGGRSDDDNEGFNPLAAVVMMIVAPIAALLIQLGISRQREYAADASAARMVGHPYGLVRALEKLGAYNKKIPMDVSPATASLYIVAPLSAGQVFLSWFSTHPPLDKRIEALENLVITR